MNETTIFNIAFFDAEFTALSAHDRGIQEMIQCSLIVHQVESSVNYDQLLRMNDVPTAVYKTYVKPMYNSELSNYIQELTGIKQEDIDNGKSFHNAIDDIYMLCSEYQVEKIVIWGPDKILLRSNCSMSGYNSRKARILCSKFQDVSNLISHHFGYDTPISQHKACQLLNISEDGTSHDAYYDAINLSKIIKKFADDNICNK